MTKTMPAELEALYPKLVNLLLDPVFVVDEHGTIVFISEACEQMLGYTASEMTGTPMLNYIHPGDLDRTLAAASRVISGQPHTDFENRYLHKDGSVVHILWSARWSEDDRLRIAVARDVTALRRANQTRDALYRVSEAAHRADSLRALCDGVRQVIGEIFPQDKLYLAFQDKARGLISAPDWSDDEPSGWVEGPMQAGTVLADVIQSGQAVRASRHPEHPGLGVNPLNLPTPPGPANWLGVPLISKDAVLGALVIESHSEGARYQQTDQELLQFVATQVATAVERKRAEENLRFMAHHDPLTGLTNRSLFYDRLETALRAASRAEGGLALLYLDLNDFKKINDARGHEAGDQLLTEMAHRLEGCTRETDTVARMGGDEFTVLLADICDHASLGTAVARIREMMALPFVLGGETFHVSCSIGAALYPEDGESAGQLVRTADARMYLNKRGN
ncbi:diguanylate cyclase domain-containing protein [Marinobacter sp.]|uniref:diguanylate cyclase domain-containing protein n=1 Tax=Marinobacter sp. TaxID=50741 RepID=UPI00384C659B